MQKPPPLPVPPLIPKYGLNNTSENREIIKVPGYDLDSIEGIESIEIPEYKSVNGVESPIDNIEYVLQRKATEHKRNGRMDLAIACLRKSNEIFPFSNFLWVYKDYMRLVEFLKQDGKFDEARKEEARIKKSFEPGPEMISHLEYIIWQCKSMKIDLIETTDNNFSCCSECAKYNKRIFSISGKDRHFPKLPEYLFKDLPGHAFCIIDFYPFFGENYHTNWLYEGSLRSWCNRPFTDERTNEQKEYFKNKVQTNLQEQIDKENYDILREKFTNLAPKSFGGYRRMKNLRSDKYSMLSKEVSSIGVDLDRLPDLSIYHF